MRTMTGKINAAKQPEGLHDGTTNDTENNNYNSQAAINGELWIDERKHNARRGQKPQRPMYGKVSATSATTRLRNNDASLSV